MRERQCCGTLYGSPHRAWCDKFKPKVEPMRESVIELHLVKRVKELGGEVRKVRWIGRRGAPDRLVMLPGGEIVSYPQHDSFTVTEPSAVWVELKAPGVKPEPHQVREHERMRKMGQRVEVIDSIEGVEALLA